MSQLTPDQLRQKYLDFFAQRGHKVIPSAALVPENDPTTLFTSAGMQPLVPYLLGQPHPEGTRLVNSQKSFRSQDIEEVGDNRHTTFFEMLGNWSLGDYFKDEQIGWVFEFLVDELGIDPQRLYVTVYGGNDEIGVPRDMEAVKRWQQVFAEKGIDVKDRIFYYGDDKNWWSRSGVPANMPVGEPGGPDSEIFYDFDPEGLKQIHQKSKFNDQTCHVNCDCGRFLEIGNSVFMQFQKTEDGFVPLKNKNIDFGGGFERILAVLNDDPDVFNTDIFRPIIDKIEELSGVNYSTQPSTINHQSSFRIISDHIRAAVMLAADGVFPGPKQQGYFSRRLVRRAVRYGRELGIEGEFVGELVGVVAEIYRDAYPNVKAQMSKIQMKLDEEERKFNKTLKRGLRNIDKGIEKVKNRWIKLAKKGGWIPLAKSAAKEAFNYYQEDGVPIDIYLEEAKKAFDGLTPFWGIALSQDNPDEIGEKEIYEIIKLEFDKLREQHAEESRTASAGMFKGGLADDSENTVKYHTATHLLHAALRKILGESVQQKGSNITGERMRFDFSFDRALTDEEKQQVEDQINDWINADLSVTRQELPKQEALDSGAIAFFIEKYPDIVNMYTIGFDTTGNKAEFDLSKKSGWISRELCGGPHVEQTGEIGQIKITKEKSASSGVRRVYVEMV